MHTARAAALVTVIDRVRRFPDLGPAQPEVAGLDPRDAALAQALDHAVARRWLTLQALLERGINRGWDRVEDPVRGALLLGAAQLALFDRIPAHAAINEMVDLIRTRRPKAAGIVNAVLRRTAELLGEPEAPSGAGSSDRATLPLSDGRVRRLAADVFSAEPIPGLSARTSVGPALLAQWTDAVGFEGAAVRARHTLVEAPIVVTGLGAETAVDARLAPHATPGFFVWRGGRGDLAAFLAGAGPAARVQDPGSARAVETTARLAPRVVVDLCAGRGTKTRRLAQLHPEAEIVATDRDATRRAALDEVAASFPNVTAIDYDALDAWRERADLVVLDVPCTNTGVLARRVEAKYRFDRESLASLVSVQRQIAVRAIPLLAPRAALLWCTCSVERQENAEQHAWLARWHRFSVVEAESIEPQGMPGDEDVAYSDGGGFALLRQA